MNKSFFSYLFISMHLHLHYGLERAVDGGLERAADGGWTDKQEQHFFFFKKTNKTKRGEGVPLTIIIEMNNTEIKTGKSYVKITLEMKHFQLCIYMLKVFKKWNALKWYKIVHFHNSHYQSVTKCTHLNKLFKSNLLQKSTPLEL